MLPFINQRLGTSCGPEDYEILTKLVVTVCHIREMERMVSEIVLTAVALLLLCGTPRSGVAGMSAIIITSVDAGASLGASLRELASDSVCTASNTHDRV